MEDEHNPKTAPTNKAKPKVLNREVYYTGDEIIRQGEEGWRAYYIESGKVDVLINDGKTRLVVAELTAGDIFGEMALITHEPRSATVRATETCTITVIDRSEIEGRIDRIQDPAIKALIKVLTNRLRDTTRGQLDHYRNLADFQDRVSSLVDRVHVGIDSKYRKQFRDDVAPLLNDLQKVLDRYKLR